MRVFINRLLLYFIVIAVISLGLWIFPSPWWLYLVPVFICGMVLSYWQPGESYAMIGFIGGFITWLVVNWYFDWSIGGGMLNKTGELMGLSGVWVFFIAGSIGGVTTSLSLYSGARCMYDIRQRNVNSSIR
jgi:hypothetical protein